GERDGAPAARGRLTQGDETRSHGAGGEARRAAGEGGDTWAAATATPGRRGFEGGHLGEVAIGLAERERRGHRAGRTLKRVRGDGVAEGRARREAGARGDGAQVPGVVHGDRKDQIAIGGGGGRAAGGAVDGGRPHGAIAGGDVERREGGDAAVLADDDAAIAG